jgi:hypothetical protein
VVDTVCGVTLEVSEHAWEVQSKEGSHSMEGMAHGTVGGDLQEQRVVEDALSRYEDEAEDVQDQLEGLRYAMLAEEVVDVVEEEE